MLACNKFGSKEFLDLVEANQYSPIMIDFLYKIGSNLKSDNLVSGDTKFGSHTPEYAQKEIKRLEGDDKFMAKYRDKKQVGHKEAVKELNDLYLLLHSK